MVEKKQRKYMYSEIFNSIQGEGLYTGVHTLWLRYFLCNLQCDVFGQIDPTNPESWELPYKDFDPKTVNRVEDLPVWEKGCDSSYSWSKKFKHLQHKHTAEEIAQLLIDSHTNEFNPEGKWTHVAFTRESGKIRVFQNGNLDQTFTG